MWRTGLGKVRSSWNDRHTCTRYTPTEDISAFIRCEGLPLSSAVQYEIKTRPVRKSRVAPIRRTEPLSGFPCNPSRVPLSPGLQYTNNPQPRQPIKATTSRRTSTRAAHTEWRLTFISTRSLERRRARDTQVVQ